VLPLESVNCFQQVQELQSVRRREIFGSQSHYSFVLTGDMPFAVLNMASRHADVLVEKHRVLSVHSGKVDRDARRYCSKANHEGHERLKTIAAVPDPVHCVLSPTVSRV
jgi:hypothetical protein